LSRIAVVGAGVFGVTSALELSKFGHFVTLFEKNTRILQEGTANSQNRLHIGLHYPRDLETAVQSRIGFERFKSVYPELVRDNFPNYYAIAAEKSKVDREAFEEFACMAGIQLVEEFYEYPFGIDRKMINGLWRCSEGVIDIDDFRFSLEKKLLESSVRFIYDTEIDRMYKRLDRWTLKDKKELEYRDFDFVIRATYGNDQIESEDVDLRMTDYEYHRTLILEVTSDCPPMGLTIVDGDFLTILPKGFTNKFLVYAPSISVLDRSIGNKPKLIWQDTGEEMISAQESLMDRVKMWLPGFHVKQIVGRRITTRSIQPNVSLTDKRVSQIKWLSEDVVEVWSGKIDHCTEIAEVLTKEVNLKSNTQINSKLR
jgi:hypothetical protein